jgi:hypothetical protein
MFSGSPTMSSVLFRNRFVFQPLMGALVVAGGISIISPASAATLASSESQVRFSRFNIDATFSGTDSTANDMTITGDDGSIISTSDASAEFENQGRGIAKTSSIAVGSGLGYEGIGTSTATLIGIFNVQDSFSFRFRSFLNLTTSVDDLTVETADADASIGILLEDITNPDAPVILDKLFLNGIASSTGPTLFSEGSTNGFEYDGSVKKKSSPTGSFSFLKSSIFGSYERQFSQSATIRLTELQQNRVRVSTSEPNAVPTPALFPGIIGFVSGLVRKRRERSLAV